MTKYEILEDINKTSIQLMLQETFYGHFFTKLLRDTVEGEHQISTACVSLNKNSNTLSLIINEDFWTKVLTHSKDGVKYSDEQIKKYKYGSIKHEILHILFKDLFNYHMFSDKRLGNMAVDFRVWQYVKEDEIILIDEMCVMKNFPHFFPDPTGKDANQTSMYYYGILVKELAETTKILNQGKGQGNRSGKGQSKPDQSPGQGNGKGDNESDEEGGGQSDNLKNNSNWDKLNSSQKKLAQFVGSEANMRMHSTWGELSKLEDGKKEFVENWTDSMIKETVKNLDQAQNSKWRGTIPAYLHQYLDSLIENMTPSVNWKKVLNEFAQNGEKTYRVGTIRRQSKRFKGMPGTRIQHSCKIQVSIDTSGSVCNESLAQFFGELHNIWKNDVEIRVVECDAAIGKIWDYDGVYPETVTGRGGTDFNPPIIYANEEYKPDAHIYFTDGECSVPVDSDCPILWLISKNQGASVEQMADFQGIKIKMDF